jgi:hypothetical protein
MKKASGVPMLNSCKDEGTIIVRNIANKGTASQPGIPEPASVVLP